MTVPTKIRTIGLYPRLFLAFVAVALLPLTMSYLMNVSDTRAETRALADDLLEQVASRTQMRRSLDNLAATGDPAERLLLERILQDLLASSDEFLGIWLRHADGGTTLGVPSTMPVAPDWSSDEAPLRFHWENNQVGGLWLTAALALDARIIGSVHVLVSLTRLGDMLNDLSEVTIGGRTLMILRAPDDRRVSVGGGARHDLDHIWSPEDLQEQQAIEVALRSASTGIGFDADRGLVYTHRALSVADSGVLVYMHLEQLDHILARQGANLALDVIVVLALSVLMAALLAHMIILPIKELTKSTKKLSQGDLSARVKPHHWGEFALLTETFNATAATLQAHTNALDAEIKRRQHAQNELISIANSDPLTGLYNRRYFLEALDKRIRDCSAGGSGGAILFIDLDGFKPVNDTYGHEAGDATLRIVAERLLNLVRSQDCVARFGGDEFVILLADAESSADPESIALRVSQSLAEPVEHDAHNIQVGGSVGVAHIEPGMTAEQVIALGDSRMYQAKIEKRAHRT